MKLTICNISSKRLSAEEEKSVFTKDVNNSHTALHELWKYIQLRYHAKVDKLIYFLPVWTNKPKYHMKRIKKEAFPRHGGKKPEKKKLLTLALEFQLKFASNIFSSTRKIKRYTPNIRISFNYEIYFAIRFCSFSYILRLIELYNTIISKKNFYKRIHVSV